MLLHGYGSTQDAVTRAVRYDVEDRERSVEMATRSMLRNTFLRTILIFSITVAVALVMYNTLLVTPSFTTLLITATETDAVRITRHLASSLLISEHTKIGRDSLKTQLLKTEIERTKKNFELMNLKVFSPSGEILYSGDPNEVGKINQNRYFHDVVAKGQVYAKVVPKDEESLEGQKVTRDVLETYVPLMNNAEFLGAFEIYFDITSRKKHLDVLLRQSSTIVAAFASALLVAILFILYRENLAIDKRRQLEEERLHRERLEGVIEMAGAACHEFGQPLQTLFGYSHLLLKHLPEDSPLFGEITEVKKAIAELGDVVHKITHITRYETKEYIEGSKIIDIDRASS
jgi:hypothetical protein